MPDERHDTSPGRTLAFGVGVEDLTLPPAAMGPRRRPGTLTQARGHGSTTENGSDCLGHRMGSVRTA
ncbi:hypothetical protein FHS42_000384 [Streptomyces zagrosensis]|uniref:Uncharacterized protein n=1 Tax=Streptomyces zagrosensis TaxID=1042984 RepID=A0A7W9Q4N5_9ACTN|nr:hypothetical protein [Streptomyces zagrosensis]